MEFLSEIKTEGSGFRGVSEGGTRKFLDHTRLNYHKHYCVGSMPGKCVERIAEL